MVDLGLGEVYGPEIFGEEPGRIIRSSHEVEATWQKTTENNQFPQRKI